MMRQFQGPAGSLEALFETPEGDPRAVVVFGHPHPQHGGTMHTKVVYRAAKTFLELGCAVLRFNFRGVGASTGQWDEGRGERDDFQAGLDCGAGAYPDTELWAAGFSFGAWIALTCGASDPRVTQLLGIAPPAGHYDFSELVASTTPTHFIHGDLDELIPLTRLRALYESLTPPKGLTVIDGASHLFEGRVSDVGEAVRNTFRVQHEEHA